MGNNLLNHFVLLRKLLQVISTLGLYKQGNSDTRQLTITEDSALFIALLAFLLSCSRLQYNATGHFRH